jgi:hypothetical protein
MAHHSEESTKESTVFKTLSRGDPGPAAERFRDADRYALLRAGGQLTGRKIPIVESLTRRGCVRSPSTVLVRLPRNPLGHIVSEKMTVGSRIGFLRGGVRPKNWPSKRFNDALATLNC